jgi:hypothetical protein
VLVEGGGDAVTTSAPPTTDSPPERVDVSCDSWAQFENAFRRKLDSHQVFVPSGHPPPAGTQLEFYFSIPDGTSIRMPGQVVSTVPPPSASQGPSSAERAGMIVEFGKFARAEEQRVRALLDSLEQQQGPSSLAPIPPERAPSTPSASPSIAPAVRALSSTPAGAGSAPARSRRPIHYDDGDAAVHEAVRLLELRLYPDAIRRLVAVLNGDPDKVSARLWLNLAGARHARELGQDAIAADCYRVVLALQPGHPEAAQQLAILTRVRPSAPLGPPRGQVIGRRITKKNPR